MNIVIHRCDDGWVLVPEIFDPGKAYFAESGPSLEFRNVACESFRSAGLSHVLDRIVAQSYLVLGHADYHRIASDLEVAEQLRIQAGTPIPAGTEVDLGEVGQEL